LFCCKEKSKKIGKKSRPFILVLMRVPMTIGEDRTGDPGKRGRKDLSMAPGAGGKARLAFRRGREKRRLAEGGSGRPRGTGKVSQN